MRKVKILYGLEAAGGGALKHVTYLATHLNKEIFDITIILSDLRKENIECEVDKIRNSGVRIIFIPITRNINLVKDIFIFVKIYNHIKNHKYNVVHAHSSKAGALFRIAAWLNNVPLIYYTPHCFYFQGQKGLPKKFFVIIEKILGIISNGIIVSENEKREALRYRIIAPDKIFSINNAIDFDEYKQSKNICEIKEKLGISVDHSVVGAIGRLVPQKDWETYIYAANEVIKTVHDVVFLIVGEGELYADISKLITKMNLNGRVILSGYIQEIHNIYGIIDVYVSTSLWEGLPYVFLEAMNYNKPIVATDTGNGSTVIHKETGFISPIKDYKAIAENIIYLIRNKNIARHMGGNGKKTLTDRYSFALFIQQHEKLYQLSQ
jgi:glycosyltransferase involved in cell wall biosynthesis